MDDQHPASEHVLTDLHDIARKVTEMYDLFKELEPIIRMFRPGNGNAIQQAGVARAMRKAARRE
jgi:hypothetical protein